MCVCCMCMSYVLCECVVWCLCVGWTASSRGSAAASAPHYPFPSCLKKVMWGTSVEYFHYSIIQFYYSTSLYHFYSQFQFCSGIAAGILSNQCSKLSNRHSRVMERCVAVL